MGKHLLKILAFLTVFFSLTGCTNMWLDFTEYFSWKGERKGVSSSLVDYLYPSGRVPPKHDEKIPHLDLPLRVGLAFVPAQSKNVRGLSEAHKTELLNNVKRSFAERDFIKEIMIIPDTYLRSAKGFDGVDQIGRLYDLDVMALVSYDQVVHADDTKASILYWTIVGSYFIKGSVNDVQTFVDTAIFDIKTHKLLFRAPGINKIEATSTLINSPEVIRKSQEESFDLAMDDMTKNLDMELKIFKTRVHEEKIAQVTYSPSYRGGGFGGAFGMYDILLLLGLVAARCCLPLAKKFLPLK